MLIEWTASGRANRWKSPIGLVKGLVWHWMRRAGPISAIVACPLLVTQVGWTITTTMALPGSGDRRLWR